MLLKGTELTALEAKAQLSEGMLKMWLLYLFQSVLLRVLTFLTPNVSLPHGERDGIDEI